MGDEEYEILKKLEVLQSGIIEIDQLLWSSFLDVRLIFTESVLPFVGALSRNSLIRPIHTTLWGNEQDQSTRAELAGITPISFRRFLFLPMNQENIVQVCDNGQVIDSKVRGGTLN